MDNLIKKEGTIFSISRPAFILGVSNINLIEKPPNIVNKRHGDGNYNITRNNFESSEIKPRMAGDFKRQEAQEAEEGIKVQLSDKTIQDLFKIKVGDKTDTQWLAEKTRLEALYRLRGMTPDEITRELEVNKPLGREQRTITSNQNIAQSSLSLGDKINEIKQEVVDGRGESRAQQAALIGQLALILANTRGIMQFTGQQAQQLTDTLMRLNVPQSHQQLGLLPRYIDYEYYTQNAGLVNLYILSNALKDPNFPIMLTLKKPVYNYAGFLAGIPSISIEQLVAYMKRDVSKRFLDLEERGIKSSDQMVAITNLLPNEWDDPSVSILPKNRPQQVQIVVNP